MMPFEEVKDIDTVRQLLTTLGITVVIPLNRDEDCYFVHNGARYHITFAIGSNFSSTISEPSIDNALPHCVSSTAKKYKSRLEKCFSISEVCLIKPAEPTCTPDMANECHNKLHLSFLFSSPLVTRHANSNGEVMPLESLNYEKDLDSLQQSLAETHCEINYRAAVATLENFRLALSEKPLALHFSGHGMKHDKMGGKFEYDFLVFEDQYGGAQFVSGLEIKNFLQQSNAVPQLVVVASCHSQVVGHIFKESGVSHVVCIKRNAKILDAVSIKFTNAFYHAVFNGASTVCDAYKASIQQLLSSQEYCSEANKFELILNESPSFHICDKLIRLKQGKPVCLTQMPEVESNGICKVENFIGRNVDMYNVITNLANNRLFTIKGVPGIGKTSLGCMVAKYLTDRGYFKQGALFISIRNIESTDALIAKLCMKLNCQYKTGIDDAIQVLKSKEMLIMLDNAEDIISVDEYNFKEGFISKILSECQKLKIIITSRTPLNVVSNITEKVYTLRGLTQEYSKQLLFSRAPRELFDEEFAALMNNSMGSPQEQQKLWGKLSGHPQTISLMAAYLQEHSLNEMCQYLQLDSDQNCLSLNSRIEKSLEFLKSKDQDAYNFFYFMSFLPDGGTMIDLSIIYGGGAPKCINALLNYSLIEREGSLQNSAIRHYSLPPFMSCYAQEHLDVKKADALMYHSKCVNFYAELLEKIFYLIGNLEKKQSEESSRLMYEEGNILKCIKFERNKTLKSRQSKIDEVNVSDNSSEEKENLFSLSKNNNSPLPTKDAVQELANCLIPKQEMDIPSLTTQSSTGEPKIIHGFMSSMIQSVTSFPCSKEDHESKSLDPLNKVLRIPEKDSDEMIMAEKVDKNGMSSLGKLTVYYVANIMLMGRYADAKKQIESVIQATFFKKDKLTKANLFKLLAVAELKLKSCSSEKQIFERVMRLAEDSRNLFNKMGSVLGEAVCFLIMAHAERRKEEFKKCEGSLHKALEKYSLINHAIGMAQIHELLGQVVRQTREFKGTV